MMYFLFLTTEVYFIGSLNWDDDLKMISLCHITLFVLRLEQSLLEETLRDCITKQKVFK